MSITKTQYDEIMRSYNQKELAHQEELRRRIEHLYNEIPRLKAINDEIITLSITQAKSKLLDLCLSEEEYSSHIKNLTEEKEKLISDSNFSNDYLLIKYQCPDCQDTGYIGTQKCHCFEQAIIDILYTQSNLREMLVQENFQNFSYDYYSDTIVDSSAEVTPLANIKKVVSTCKRFIDNFESEFSNLLFYGVTGTGKTFLTNCIAKELMDRSYSAIYLSAIQLFEIFADSTFHHSNTPEKASNRMKHILECDLLIIDDLGTELVNTFTSSALFNCLNERLIRKKSTIISTNLPLEDLQNRYSDRILSRIVSSYSLLLLFGEDIRIKKKLENK